MNLFIDLALVQWVREVSRPPFEIGAKSLSRLNVLRTDVVGSDRSVGSRGHFFRRSFNVGDMEPGPRRS